MHIIKDCPYVTLASFRTIFLLFYCQNADTTKSRTTDSSLSREESIAQEESIGRSHRENGVSNAETESRENNDVESLLDSLQNASTPKRNQEEYPNLPSQEEAPQQSQFNNTSTQLAQNNAPQ